MKNQSNKKTKKKILNSKKTTAILVSVILLPFLIFGFILIKDKIGTGTPVVGSRNEHQLEHKISDEQLSKLEELLKIEEATSSKVTLRASTLRLYLVVSKDMSKEKIEALADGIYDKVLEIVPIDPYFKNSETNKQYDLEIHVYNDVEDKAGDDFVYYEIIRAASMEETSYAFVSDAKDPEFKEEVLELMEEIKAEAEKNAEESEDDEGGE